MPLARSKSLEFARSLVVAALLVALLASCGRRGTSKIAGPPPDQGVPAEAVAEAVNTIDFAHFVVNSATYGWTPDAVLDRSWHYDASRTTWTKLDSSYQSTFVGSGTGGPSYEVRNESVVAFEVQLFQGAIPVQNLADADRASMDLRVRRRRYALDHHLLSDSYDVTVTHQLGFPVAPPSNAADFETSGSVTGWSAKTWNGVPRVRNYDGSVESSLTYTSFGRCPKERMATSFAVTHDGIELDRYSGSVTADEGVELMTGTIHSERGPGGIAFNRNRGCPTHS